MTVQFSITCDYIHYLVNKNQLYCLSLLLGIVCRNKQGILGCLTGFNWLGQKLENICTKKDSFDICFFRYWVFIVFWLISADLSKNIKRCLSKSL